MSIQRIYSWLLFKNHNLKCWWKSNAKTKFFVGTWVLSKVSPAAYSPPLILPPPTAGLLILAAMSAVCSRTAYRESQKLKSFYSAKRYTYICLVGMIYWTFSMVCSHLMRKSYDTYYYIYLCISHCLFCLTFFLSLRCRRDQDIKGV